MAGALTVTPDRIRDLPALTVLANPTGATADAHAVNGVTLRTMIGLGSVDAVQFGSLALSGNLEVRSGVDASEFRLFEPSGSGTNYTAFKAQPQAGNITYTLPAADGSTGQYLKTDGSGALSWGTVDLSGYLPLAGGTLTGDLLFFPTNTHDIGNGTYDPRTVRAATSVLTPLVSTASGPLTLSSTSGIIGIGGATSSYPALKRNSAVLEVKLSDDSAFAALKAKSLDIDGVGSLYIQGGAYTTLGAQNTGYPVFLVGNGSGACLRLMEGTYNYTIDIKPVGSNSIAGVFTGQGTSNPASGALATWQCATVDNPTAALTLGNATYGVSVPGAAVIGDNTASGPFLLLSDALDSNRFGVAHKYGPSSWTSGCDSNWVTGEVRVGGFIASYYPVIYSGGNAALSFTTAGAATFSGSVKETYKQSTLDPTTSDIASGKRQGWLNTVLDEFRDWVNVGGVMRKSGAYT